MQPKLICVYALKFLEQNRLLLGHASSDMRKREVENRAAPPQFSRPEVPEILSKYYEGVSEHEKVKVELKRQAAR